MNAFSRLPLCVLFGVLLIFAPVNGLADEATPTPPEPPEETASDMDWLAYWLNAGEHCRAELKENWERYDALWQQFVNASSDTIRMALLETISEVLRVIGLCQSDKSRATDALASEHRNAAS